MTTVSQAVATRETGPVTLMWGRKKHFDAVLPAHVDVTSFLGTAAGALYGNKDLMEAATRSPDSLIVALMRCAALGHQPGTDEFYLTPRKRKGVPEILGIEGYRGIVERMYRSGAVASVVVREVCAGDSFRYVEGVDDKPVHSAGGEGSTGADFFGKTGSRSRGEMVGVYAYAILTTGAVSRVVLLTRDDVLAARDAGGYRADDAYSPWNRMDGGKDHPEFKGRSMWWKTAARRLEPWVPTSAEYRREQLRASATAAGLTAPQQHQPSAPVPPDSGIVDAEIVDDTQNVPPAEASPQAETAAPPQRPAGGTPDPGPAPGSDEYKAALNMAQAQGKRLFGDDRGGRLEAATAVLRMAEGSLESFSDLTAGELVTVGETFARARNIAALRKLLTDGEVPDGQ
jgi:recombination protein RecT